MVHFSHPTLGTDDRLTISAGYEPDGYRLVVDFPDGRQLIHRFFDRDALYRGTVKLQTELLGDGWLIASTHPPRRTHRHGVRRRQFPRTTPF